MVQQLQAELQDKAQQLQAAEWEKCRELQAQEQRVQRLSQNLARKEQLLQVRCGKIQVSITSQDHCSSFGVWCCESQSVEFMLALQTREEMLLGSQDEKEYLRILKVPQPSAMPGEPWQVLLNQPQVLGLYCPLMWG